MLQLITKYNGWLIIVLVISVVFVSCVRKQSSDACGDCPSISLERFISAISSNKYNEAYGYIVTKDAEYIQSLTLKQKKVLSLIYTYTEIRIISAKTYDYSAEILVYFRSPNVGYFFGDYAVGLTGDKRFIEEDIYEQMLNRLAGKDYGFIEYEEKINLSLVDDCWKIDFGFDEKIKINSLLSDALRKFSEKKYDEAILLINLVLDIDSNHKMAKMILDRIEARKK